LLLLALAAGGCSWSPPRDDGADTGHSGSGGLASWGRYPGEQEQDRVSGALGNQIVATARQMIGVPYVYGGANPGGFDCSGLVYYAYRQAGLKVPRTSEAQFRAAQPVALGAARPGDLLFFESGGRISHVGIYIGAERFIHAPETGQTVKITAVGEPYYRQRFVAAGRITGRQ
jgi:cell wall-associated NlpC family hydrolase